MASSLSSLCVPETFNSPSVFGAEIRSLETNLVSDFSISIPETSRFTQPAVELKNATFCNVTVSYTHPGQNDNIIVETWLPADNWNGRLQAVGGGGWILGRFAFSYNNMYGAIADGYATITTDAGVPSNDSPETWALISPGNVNLYNLQNLASVSLNDEAIIGKSLIKDFYGKGPDFSYWNGCSQGGRQGMMLAQRYPTAYDGIAVGAPGIYWTEFFPFLQWSQQVMSLLGEYPYGCELDAITSAAISACDKLDGVVDGVITEPDACLGVFNPFSLVNTTIDCSQTNGTIKISKIAAAVANATWQGTLSDKDAKAGWFGLNPGADLTGNMLYSPGYGGIAATNCSSGTCVGLPVAYGIQWLQLFGAQGADLDVTSLTRAQFGDWVYAAQQRFKSIIDTSDADLTQFRDAGGKLVMYHGIQDNIVPTKGSEKYYNEVNARVSDVDGFYRYFEVPGLGHCGYGPGGLPTGLFEQLRNWVENGTAPEQTSFELKGVNGTSQNRIACPYPQKAKLDETCGDAANSKCWLCS
ncbi:tannase and feruloyl esterase [Annulohypoxylon maeteangense]|uniref:tannase and feruloyl esterase n=1 Tax=Annulohypoxylon maeteangense TaxID=1927788 RepID=UPI002007CC1F|nr:tannase and feruloyl esterase [Annulohypoxylon maeteangense]KAI0883782.1 tannase and feruloyl esterase [Annulohypoxylon maeteangense]